MDDGTINTITIIFLIMAKCFKRFILSFFWIIKQFLISVLPADKGTAQY